MHNEEFLSVCFVGRIVLQQKRELKLHQFILKLASKNPYCRIKMVIIDRNVGSSKFLQVPWYVYLWYVHCTPMMNFDFLLDFYWPIIFWPLRALGSEYLRSCFNYLSANPGKKKVKLSKNLGFRDFEKKSIYILVWL